MQTHLALLISCALATSTTKSKVDIFPLSTALPITMTITIPTETITTTGKPNVRRADGPPTVDSLEPLTSVDPHAVTSTAPSLSENVPRPSVSSSHFSMPPPITISSGVSGGGNAGSSSSSSTTSLGTTRREPATLTMPPSTPSVVSVLWQPSSNVAKRLSVPRIILGLLSLRAVAAHSILASDHASHTTAAIAPTLSLSLIPHTISPTSYPTTPLALPLNVLATTCPKAQIHCGINACYDPKAHWCCPSRLHICALGESCAEGKAGESEMVYGCAPAGVQNGTDSRIKTTVVSTSAATAMTSMTAAQTSASMATSAVEVKPMGSAGNRLGVPSFVQYLGLLVRGAKGVAFPRAVRPECCGDICCEQGELCTRSSDGAKCWPQAQRRDGDKAAEHESRPAAVAVEIVGEETSEEAEDGGDEDMLIVGDKKGGGGRGGGGGGGSRDSAGGGHVGVGSGGGGDGNGKKKKGSAARPAIPTMLYIFFLLLPSAISHLLLPTFDAAAHPRTIGTPQIDPNRPLIEKQSQLLHKRWSCHKPNQECGPGCWNPAQHFCCIQPSGKSYGLCAADQGQSCCGTKCCPKDTYCQNKEGYTCVPKMMG